MPSASTTRPLAASAAIESSLCERTMPGSVLLAISRVWVRSIASLDLDVHAAGGRPGNGRAAHRRAQRAAELLAGLVALVGVLGQRLVEERDQRRRHVGI